MQRARQQVQRARQQEVTAAALPQTSFHRFKFNFIRNSFNSESRFNCFYDRLIQTWQAATQSTRPEVTDMIAASDSATESGDHGSDDGIKDRVEELDSDNDAIPASVKKGKCGGSKPKRKKVEKRSFLKIQAILTLFSSVTPFWISSTSVADISDPLCHIELLELAKTAVQVYDMFGLKDIKQVIFSEKTI